MAKFYSPGRQEERMRRAITLLVFWFFLGSGGLLSAATLDTSAAEKPAETGNPEVLRDEQKKPEEEEDEEPGIIDVTHERVSEAILASANWIDSFFSDERWVREETETRFRLRISNFTGKGDLFKTDLRTGFRLDLPVFSEKLHILLSGEEEDETLTLERRVPRRVVTGREREASVSLRYFLLMTLRRNASLSTGLRFRNGSPVFLFEPRYRQIFPLNHWDLRFTQRFTAFSDDSLEIRTIFDLERPVYDRFFFRTTADGIWFDDEHGYFYNFHISLYQPLSRDRMLQYLWSNNFVTRPTHALDEVRFILSYRQRIWRQWLFIELSPQIAFPREEDYEISPGALLRLDIIFGEFSSFRIHDI